MHGMKIDYSLYLVTDPNLSRGRGYHEIVEAAIQGGATIVQYREKNAGTRQMIREAAELQEFCRTLRVPLIVNDRVDIALAVNADGVHVGQDDMPPHLARRLIGPEKILGVSAETPEQATQAIADGADYIGASAVFATPTKQDIGKPIGLEGLAAIARVSTVPVVAIGGINAGNAAEVIRAGALGIAVVSAVVSAEDVRAAARELRRIVEEARQKQGRMAGEV